MPLDKPRRAPITDPIWQRYFDELQERTGTPDTDYIREDRFMATDQSSAAMRGVRREAKRARDRAFLETIPARDVRVSRHARQLRELHFAEGF